MEMNQALVYKEFDYIFKSYMTFLASQKIQYSKIPKSHPNDLDGYCAFLNKSMNFEHKDDIFLPSLLTPNLHNVSISKILQISF